MPLDCPDCQRYLELLREQDTFIQKIKRFVRDFNIRDGEYDAFKRDIADRGFRAPVEYHGEVEYPIWRER